MPWLPSAVVQGIVSVTRGAGSSKRWRAALALLAEERCSDYLNSVSDWVSVCTLSLPKAGQHPLNSTQGLYLLLNNGILVLISSPATSRDLSIFLLLCLSVRDQKRKKCWSDILTSSLFF